MTHRNQIDILKALASFESNPKRLEHINEAIEIIEHSWQEWLQPGHQVKAMELDNKATGILDALQINHNFT